jgi:hypothetical protein
MKYNIGEKLFTADYGRDDDGDFSSVFSNTSQRRLSCYCKKCNSYLGTINFTESNFVKMQSEDIDRDILDEIIPVSAAVGMDHFKAYCSQCGKKRVHYMVDFGMGPLIQKLNRLGLKTRFSCEAHEISRSSGVSLPYVAFKDDISKYFDIDHPLLKMWDIEVYEKGELYKARSILRVSKNVTIEYLMEDIPINDLEEYVDTVLMKDKNFLQSMRSKKKKKKKKDDTLKKGTSNEPSFFEKYEEMRKMYGGYPQTPPQIFMPDMKKTYTGSTTLKEGEMLSDKYDSKRTTRSLLGDHPYFSSLIRNDKIGGNNLDYLARLMFRNKGPSLKEFSQKYFPDINIRDSEVSIQKGTEDTQNSESTDDDQVKVVARPIPEDVYKKLRLTALKGYIEMGIPPVMVGFSDEEVQELLNQGVDEKKNKEAEE